jgi:hypothetical protein
MAQIGLYNPKRSSTIVHVGEGSDFSDLTELGFRQFHENNKDLLFIDWQPLFDWINSQTNTDVKFDIDLSGRRPEIVSPNIVEHCGAFASVCETVEVQFFGLGMDELGFASTVSLRYMSWSGGSNGMNIGDVYYSHEFKKWNFESTKERTLKYRQNG